MNTRNCTRTISGVFSPQVNCIRGLPIGGRIRKGIDGVRAWITTWRRRRRYRAYLATMEDRDLRDIGLCRSDAEREANLPAWRAAEIDETSRGRTRRR